MDLQRKVISLHTAKQIIAKVFKEWHTVPSYQRHYVWESDDVNDIE